MITKPSDSNNFNDFINQEQTSTISILFLLSDIINEFFYSGKWTSNVRRHALNIHKDFS